MSEAAATPIDDTLFSIYAIGIENYVPDYFLGEKYNPACDNCKDKDVSWSSNENLADHSRPEPDSTSCSSANSLKSSQSFDTFESNADHVEEFLKHLHYDGAESKYSLLVVLAKNISRSTERILDVCIADIKSHSKCLNDHCYKIAFPQLCSALRNFIWKKNLILFFRHLAYIFGQAPCLYHWIY